MKYDIVTSGGKKYFPVSANSFFKLSNTDSYQCFIHLKDRFLMAKPEHVSLKDYVKNNSIATIYLNQNDLFRYTQEIIKVNHLQGPESNRLQSLAERTQIALWTLQSEGISHQTMPLVESIAKSIVEMGTNQKITELFLKIPPGDAQKYLIRTILSKIVCHNLSFTSESTLYKVTLSSLLCDLGLYHNPKNIFHGQASLDQMASLKIPSDVQSIILHHHELNDGSGPLKVSRHKIHPLAKIIRVTDEFCDILFAQKLEKNIIFSMLYSQSPQKYELNIVKALSQAFTK